MIPDYCTKYEQNQHILLYHNEHNTDEKSAIIIYIWQPQQAMIPDHGENPSNHQGGMYEDRWINKWAGPIHIYSLIMLFWSGEY